MRLRQYLIPIGLSFILTATLFAICYPPTVRVVQELVAWILPNSIPDTGFAVVVDGLTAGLLALPGLILVIVLDRTLNRP